MPTAARKPLPRPFVLACVGFGVLTVAWLSLSFVALAVRQSEDTATVYRGVDQLRIDGGAGDVTVVAEAREDVRVVAHRSWSLSEPDHRQNLVGGVLKLDGGCGFWGSFGFGGCSTDYEVRVPEEMPVAIDASSGDVRAVGLRGPVKLSASSGDVHAEDLSGDLTIDVSSGDVTVSGYRGREVSAHASSGDVEVRAQLVPTDVTAVTSSGDVTIAVPGGEQYRVETETGSGDTDVQVDQSLDAPRTIEARAGSGDIRVVRLGDAR